MELRGKRHSKGWAFGLALALVFGSVTTAFGAVTVSAPAKEPNILQGYIKPDVTVKYNAETLAFNDANGQPVYPVICGGSTYLPVRAISSLMGENIEWRPTLNTIFIGKTLSNPTKLARIDTESYAQVVSDSAIITGLKPTLVSLAVRPQYKVMFDFEEQIFTDADGNRVYPLIYEGTTYLPVRAISSLMGQTIEWDGNTKIVYIGSKTPLTKEEVKVHTVPQSTKDIQALYTSVAALYTDATATISTLQTITDAAGFAKLAETISADYALAEGYASQAKALTAKYEDLTEEEEAALVQLDHFAGVNQYYILTMENIVYMLLEGQDFTIMADAFEQYAYDAMTDCEAARLAIEAL